MEPKGPQRPIFGKETGALLLPDFRLVESVYPSSSTMPCHRHDLAHVSIGLQGAYAERYGLKTRSCEPSTRVLHPPGEDHSVTFYKAGARVFSVHLNHQWLERVGDYTKVLDGPADFRGGLPSLLVVRLYREFQEADRVSPLMIEGLALEIIAAVSRNVGLKK